MSLELECGGLSRANTSSCHMTPLFFPPPQFWLILPSRQALTAPLSPVYPALFLLVLSLCSCHTNHIPNGHTRGGDLYLYSQLFIYFYMKVAIYPPRVGGKNREGLFPTYIGPQRLLPLYAQQFDPAHTSSVSPRYICTEKRVSPFREGMHLMFLQFQEFLC